MAEAILSNGRSRVDSPERWQRALDRALANCLDVLVEPISGEAFVESSSRPGTLYFVSRGFCSCKAGRAGIPCQHRAAYLAQLGELPLEPQPAPTDCPECRGCGLLYDRELERAGLLYPTCPACGGTGLAPDPRLHGAPSFVPIAADAAA